MSSAEELSATDNEMLSMQGVAIVRDSERGAYVTVAKAVTKASGANGTFKEMCAKLEMDSKETTTGSKFAAGYPFAPPSTTMRGHAKGKFSDLEIIVAVAMKPGGNNDCLTRLENGLFHWSEGTCNKIGNAATEEKRLKLVISMISLFINLMLDLDDNLSEGSFFEDFMGDYNLLTKKVN